MRILFVNSVCGVGSTGRICCELADKLTAEGNECKIAYGRGDVPAEYRKYAYKIGSFIDVYWHVLMTRLFDRHGLASKMATYKFIKWANDFNPDVLWLHNIHGYYINYEILFDWIKSRPNMQVKWTLHDCWAFTGHCSHYMYVKCKKWIYGKYTCNCEDCPQVTEYPKSYFISNSKNNYKRKLKSFLNVKNMEIIVPSNWLKCEVEESFLKEYNVHVKYNTIDTTVFKYTENDIKYKYGINDKILLLGVANVWSKKKGIDDFIKLSTMLGDNYVLMLIGIDKKMLRYLTKRLLNNFDFVDNYMFIKKQDNNETKYQFKLDISLCVKQGVINIFENLTKEKYDNKFSLVNRIIVLSNISNKEELAKIYSATDCFINPTYEDNYPTVNLESIACGTKVITYDTGGSRETLISTTKGE